MESAEGTKPLKHDKFIPVIKARTWPKENERGMGGFSHKKKWMKAIANTRIILEEKLQHMGPQ